MSFINTFQHLVNHPLNRSDKLGAIARYLKWQVGSRLVPGEVVFHWINNTKLIARAGETGVTGNIYCGLHEFPDMAFLLHALRKEDLFVDVGANSGTYTILGCGVIGARGYCFEPVPSSFNRLQTNIRLNNLEHNMVSLNMALGNSKGKIAFSSDLDTVNHVVANGESLLQQITVEVSTLDEQLEGKPFLIKIDVEGYEMPVLEGAEQTLQTPELSVVIMELNGSGARYGFDESLILQKMHDLGFGTFAYDPFKRMLHNLEGKNVEEGNTLFIRNMDRVVERIKSANKFEVHGAAI